MNHQLTLNKLRHDVSLIFILFAILYFSLSSLGSSFNITPEENIRVFFLNQIYNNKSFDLNYVENANSKYSTDLIKPRNTVNSPNSQEIAPSDFVGIYIYSIVPFLLLNGSFWTVIFPIFSLLGIFSVYQIACSLQGKKAGILAAFLVALFPPYLFWSNRLMTDIPSIALILFGLSYYIKQVKSGEYSLKSAILIGLLLSTGISIRYTNVIFVGLSLLIFFKFIINKSTLKFYFLMLLTMFIILLQILIVNNNIYGNPFLTGQAVYSGSATSIRTKDISLISHFIKFYINFFGILIIFFALNFFHSIRNVSKSLINFKFALLTLLLILINVLVFGKSDVFGLLSPHVLLYYSQVRYYLGVYMMLLVNASIFMSTINRHLTIVYSAMIVIFIMNLISYRESGLLPHQQEVKASNEFQKILIDNTDKDSYVFTRIYDRLIFPQRKVITYYNSGLDPINKRVENTVNLAIALKKDKQKVYFLKEDVDPIITKERNYEPFSLYQKTFAKYSMQLKEINDPIYEVIIN